MITFMRIIFPHMLREKALLSGFGEKRLLSWPVVLEKSDSITSPLNLHSLQCRFASFPNYLVFQVNGCLKVLVFNYSDCICIGTHHGSYPVKHAACYVKLCTVYLTLPRSICLSSHNLAFYCFHSHLKCHVMAVH